MDLLVSRVHLVHKDSRDFADHQVHLEEVVQWVHQGLQDRTDNLDHLARREL